MKPINRTVVYADGTFDLFHSGHIAFLKQAKSYGNYLIVGVLDNPSIASYKPEPILSLQERAHFLQSIQIIDEIIAPAPFPGRHQGELNDDFLDQHRIDYVAYSGDLGEWSDHYQAPIKRNIMKTFPYSHDELSSSEIVRRILNRPTL